MYVDTYVDIALRQERIAEIQEDRYFQCRLILTEKLKHLFTIPFVVDYCLLTTDAQKYETTECLYHLNWTTN